MGPCRDPGLCRETQPRPLSPHLGDAAQVAHGHLTGQQPVAVVDLRAGHPGEQAGELWRGKAGCQAAVAQHSHRHSGAEGTEEALAIQQRDGHPDDRRDEGALGHGAEHVAEHGRVLGPAAWRPLPLLSQHGHVVVQDQAQQEQHQGRRQQDASAVGCVVAGQAGAVKIEG